MGMGMRLALAAASAAAVMGQHIGLVGADPGRVIEVRLEPPRIVVPCCRSRSTVVDEIKLVFRLTAV